MHLRLHLLSLQLNHACHDCSMSESNLQLENAMAEAEAQQLIKRAKAESI